MEGMARMLHYMHSLYILKYVNRVEHVVSNSQPTPKLASEHDKHLDAGR